MLLLCITLVVTLLLCNTALCGGAGDATNLYAQIKTRAPTGVPQCQLNHAVVAANDEIQTMLRRNSVSSTTVPASLLALPTNTTPCQVLFLLEALGVGISQSSLTSEHSVSLLLAYEAATCEGTSNCHRRRNRSPVPGQVIAMRYSAMYLLTRFPECLRHVRAGNGRKSWGLPTDWPYLANLFLVAPWDISLILSLIEAGHPEVSFQTPNRQKSSLAILMTSVNEQEVFSVRRGLLMTAHAISNELVRSCQEAFLSFTTSPGSIHEVQIVPSQLNSTSRVETFASMMYRLKFHEYNALPSFRKVCMNLQARARTLQNSPADTFLSRTELWDIFEERSALFVARIMASPASPLRDLDAITADGSNFLHELARQGFGKVVAELGKGFARVLERSTSEPKLRCDIVRGLRTALMQQEYFNGRTPLHLAVLLHGSESRVFKEMELLTHFIFDSQFDTGISPRCKLAPWQNNFVENFIADRLNNTVMSYVVGDNSRQWRPESLARNQTADRSGLRESDTRYDIVGKGGWDRFGFKQSLQLRPAQRCDVEEIWAPPTTELLTNALASGRPVIFRNGIKKFREIDLRDWTLSSFVRENGEDLLRVESIPFETYLKADGVPASQHVRVDDYVRGFANSTSEESGPLYSFNGVESGTDLERKIEDKLKGFLHRITKLPGISLSSTKSVRNSRDMSAMEVCCEC